jgi:magnesium transporter
MMTFHVLGRPAVDCLDFAQCPILTSEAVWIDLFEPTKEEEETIEAALGINVPTREHMQEIESSSRLRRENGVLFMTAQVLSQSYTAAPASTAITFILDAKQRLVTVRYAEPVPFRTVRNYRDAETGKLGSGQAVLEALIDAIVDRLADILESVGTKLDEISSELFGTKPPIATALSGVRSPANGSAELTTRKASKGPNYRDVLVRIGRCNDLISKARESAVGLGRVISFLQEDRKKAAVAGAKELGSHLKTVGADLGSLGDHTSYLSSKANFLLDTTLGLINIEQNGIIKIFSVAAVVLLPPTLVASVYGMNFEVMPDLKWFFGYPFALALMAFSAIVPYLLFKKKGWL